MSTAFGTVPCRQCLSWLRKGSAGSARGAARLATDTLALIRRSKLTGRDVLVRADSAFYSHVLVAAVLAAGADVSITVRMDPAVKQAIAGIGEDAWTTIKYTDAVFHETTSTWVSRAQVAKVPFTAFISKKKAEQIAGPLIVRRIPELNPKHSDGQETLFYACRFHAFFTTTDPMPWTRLPRIRPTAGTRSSRTSTPI